MKLTLRVLILSVVVAGAAAASFSSVAPKQAIASHLSATSGLPVPGCGPGMGCSATTK
jgi:hypothetical protein